MKFLDTRVLDSEGSMPLISTALYASPGLAFAGMTCLNLIQMGTGFYNRIGQKVTIRSYDLSCSFANQADPITTNVIARFLLVWDKSPNGTAPVMMDILGGTNYSGATGVGFNVKSFIPNSSRFIILRDKTVEGNPGKNSQPQVHLFGKCNLVSHYGSNSDPPAIANIREGALLFIGFYDDSAGGASAYDITSRIAYTDG